MSKKIVIFLLFKQYFRHSIKKDNLIKLFENQDNKKIIELRNSKKRKLKEINNRTIYAIQKAIDYLEIDKNLLDILLLSKKCKETFNKKILKLLLFFYPDENVISQHRTTLWMGSLNIVN